MKKGIFTILFMMIITIIFISALAFVNEISKDQIIKNLEIENYKSILYAFNILPNNINEQTLSPTSTTTDLKWEENKIISNILKNIKMIKLPISDNQKTYLVNSYLWWQDSVEIYVHINTEHEILSYGFPLKGKGLWGTITAFGVISADLQSMIGIDFTEQVETPGLGARIIETEFKIFFRNLDLSGFHAGRKNPITMVRKKTETNIVKQTNSLQAITGATQTCNGVLNMMNTDLLFYIDVIQKNEIILKNKISQRRG